MKVFLKLISAGGNGGQKVVHSFLWAVWRYDLRPKFSSKVLMVAKKGNLKILPKKAIWKYCQKGQFGKIANKSSLKILPKKQVWKYCQKREFENIGKKRQFENIAKKGS